MLELKLAPPPHLYFLIYWKSEKHQWLTEWVTKPDHMCVMCFHKLIERNETFSSMSAASKWMVSSRLFRPKPKSLSVLNANFLRTWYITCAHVEHILLCISRGMWISFAPQLNELLNASWYMFEKATCQLEPGLGPKPPFENLTSEKMIVLNFNCSQLYLNRFPL